ncbi:TIR domain-containing protein [Aminobacter sp. NyZ550]|uniref:TIR domain-containing protein n=1 Tax=Aminobacter sp. NyZ550 TaxID=2979870 RepID=UPI0021D5ED48|nr:TIR domain-containing protein [Aminobacter sp. NyZ550]WAX95745.1 TIR domain-containing protein [Aminobacter sp. NyZ550]
MPSVFFSYSHADETLRDELEKQLSMLKRQGLIQTWHDRRIGAGEEIDKSIDERINKDDIILLLVSPDFLASNYCYDIEMSRALERHATGEAIVIPVILRPCDWHPAPFGKLNATPPDGKPITKWADRDEAFLEVAKALRAALTRRGATTSTPGTVASGSDARILHAIATQPTGPRSSNLRTTKVFTERDRDRFKLETFEYMARFFENSLEEMGKRDPGIEGSFRRVDANRFFAAVYHNGEAKARCTVFMDGGFGDGICYVNGESASSNSMNESLRVEADEHALFLKSMGMASHYRYGSEQKLSQDGAAELYWGLLIEPLQRR